MSKEKLDLLLNRWISRKLLVFIVASFGLFFTSIDSQDWTTIAITYIGSQAVVDMVERIYKSKNI